MQTCAGEPLRGKSLSLGIALSVRRSLTVHCAHESVSVNAQAAEDDMKTRLAEGRDTRMTRRPMIKVPGPCISTALVPLERRKVRESGVDTCGNEVATVLRRGVSLAR